MHYTLLLHAINMLKTSVLQQRLAKEAKLSVQMCITYYVYTQHFVHEHIVHVLSPPKCVKIESFGKCTENSLSTEKTTTQ